jgi:putative transposase
MKYAVMKGHHRQLNVRHMCNTLTVHPSGFYAWLKPPFSKRADEDKRQAELLNAAGKTVSRSTATVSRMMTFKT